MSKKTKYHRHGGEIHIEVTEEGKLTEHVCIGKIDENRQDYQEHTKLLVRACNSHKDLLFLVENYAAVLQEGHAACGGPGCAVCKELKNTEAAIAKAKEN